MFASASSCDEVRMVLRSWVKVSSTVAPSRRPSAHSTSEPRSAPLSYPRRISSSANGPIRSPSRTTQISSIQPPLYPAL
jgi:hypothetical protein